MAAQHQFTTNILDKIPKTCCEEKACLHDICGNDAGQQVAQGETAMANGDIVGGSTDADDEGDQVRDGKLRLWLL